MGVGIGKGLKVGNKLFGIVAVFHAFHAIDHLISNGKIGVNARRTRSLIAISASPNGQSAISVGAIKPCIQGNFIDLGSKTLFQIVIKGEIGMCWLSIRFGFSEILERMQTAILQSSLP